MPVVIVQNSSSNLSGIGDYISQSSKTEIITSGGETKELISAKDCIPDPKVAVQEMNTTKQRYSKTGGRTYKHYIQSFHKDENVSAEQVHEIAQKFANNHKWEGYEVLIATHKDADHLHSHFIVNSVNFETGKKYQENRIDLQYLKAYNDDIARDYGIEPPRSYQKTDQPSKDKTTAYSNRKYQSLMKHYSAETEYQSDLVETAQDILDIQEQDINSWKEFEEKLQKKGYQIKWEKKKGGQLKYTTYTHPNGRKFRCRNLRKTLKIPNFNRSSIISKMNIEIEKRLTHYRNHIKKIEKVISQTEDPDPEVLSELKKQKIETQNKIEKLELQIGSEPQKQAKNKSKEKKQGQGFELEL